MPGQEAPEERDLTKLRKSEKNSAGLRENATK
jgi:hypothetical protein